MSAKKTLVTLKSIGAKLDKHDSMFKRLALVLGDLSQKVYEIGEDVKDTNSKIIHLPTKEEFYKMESELLGEVKAEREENILIQGQLSAHDDRISSIEGKLAI